MRILVVEDDRRIASFLSRGLQAEGHQVTEVADGRDGLEAGRSSEYELIILDRMLPYLDGLEVCRILREEAVSTPILMLTARDSLQDKVEGLKGGADDYLTKPFAFDELMARIVALSRRTGLERDKLIRVGDIALDPQSHRVSKAGKPLTLTAREFGLLRYLMENAEKVVSRQRLLSGVWDYGYDPGTKIVDVYIRYLRQKIDDPDAPSLIETVRGVGYMMTDRPAASRG